MTVSDPCYGIHNFVEGICTECKQPRVDPVVQLYQHDKAQENLAHTPRPVDKAFPHVCVVCHMRIHPVDEDEGPESLRVLLSFR